MAGLPSPNFAVLIPAGVQTRYGTHAEGKDSVAVSEAAHAEGNHTLASGNSAHAEGYNTTASGDAAHAEGNATTASGSSSHSEGNFTTASGVYAHAEGDTTHALGLNAHTEGKDTYAGAFAHAEGSDTHAMTYGLPVNCEPNLPITLYATNEYTVVLPSIPEEMFIGTAVTFETNDDAPTFQGTVSDIDGLSIRVHCETTEITSPGTIYSFYLPTVLSPDAESFGHSEGKSTAAHGKASHTEGIYSMALGDYSHAQNEGTIAQGTNETAIGRYNTINATEGDPILPYENNRAFVVGNGTVEGKNTTRSDALTLDWAGNLWTAGSQTATQFKLSALNTAPASATDTGVAGEIRVTADYIYVCVATNAWKRTALTTW